MPHQDIAHLQEIIAEVDRALLNGMDEDVWPPGLTRGEAISRLVDLATHHTGLTPGEEVLHCFMCNCYTRSTLAPQRDGSPYCPGCQGHYTSKPFPWHRDKENPCSDFYPGGVTEEGDCMGDHHYLCRECMEFDSNSRHGYHED